MSELGALSEALFPDRDARFFGVGVGIVTNNQDPSGNARVKVSLPWLGDSHESFWARLVTPMAGPSRGLYLLPEVNDEVLVAFEHGSPDRVFVLGALWNSRDRPPERGNDRRTLKSRSGHVIRLDDTDGKERIEIVEKSGRTRIVINTAQQSIAIHADGPIRITAGGELKLSGNGIEIESRRGIAIKAAQTVDVTASGPLTIAGATVDIN